MAPSFVRLCHIYGYWYKLIIGDFLHAKLLASMQVCSELQPCTLQEEKQILALSLTGKHSKYAEELWYWLLQVINCKDNQDLVPVCSEERIMESRLLAEVSEVITSFHVGLCEELPHRLMN